MKDETVAQINMFFIFIVANLLALVLVPVYYDMYHGSMGEEGSNPWIAIYYILYIIGVTAVILYIAKIKKIGLLKGIFYFAVAWTMIFSLMPIFYFLNFPYPGILSIITAVLLTVALAVHPEWYLMDITGVLMAVGIALILGLSLGMAPIILLLSLLAIYDAISVYKTKHMVSLAENVIEYNLPALFVIPSKSDFSFKKARPITKTSKAESEEKRPQREAYYMGFGDVMIPGILVIAAATNFGMLAGVFTLAGSVAAMLLLNVMVNTGKPQPGLPYLNGGALGGLILFLFFFG